MKNFFLYNRLITICFIMLFGPGLAIGQVFMTELADPNNNANARYIELYNAGVSAVDFTEGSGWRINKYTNGSATVSQYIDLTGTILAGDFYIIAYDVTSGTFQSVYGFAPDQLDAVSNGVAGANGDDTIELLDGTGAVVDFYGMQPHTDLTGTVWEYEDGRAERASDATSGKNPPVDADWNTWSDGPGGDIILTRNAPQNFDPAAWIGVSSSGQTITVTPTSLSSFSYVEGSGPSSEQSFDISGADLTDDISITPPTNYEISTGTGGSFVPTNPITLIQSGGTVSSTTIYVRLKAGLSVGTYNGEDISATSTGATIKTVTCNGAVIPLSGPTITVTPTSLSSFSYVEGSGPSSEQFFDISGADLTDDISITPPTNYEISTGTGGSFVPTNPITLIQSGGTVSSTTIYVRLKAGLSGGAYNGEDITATSTGATNKTVTCNGAVIPSSFPNAWINEFHYDNDGGDVGEFVEIVIEDPGSYTLSDFQVNLYNGYNGTSYNYGIALSYFGSVITGQFLSYEGSFTATDGPANGLTSTDIDVSEPFDTPVGYSLQLGGTGTQYSDFTWNIPAPETKGTLNNGQTLSSGSGPTITVTPTSLSGFSYLEGGGPSASQSYDLSGSDLTPASGDITVTGSTNYEVSLNDADFSGSANVGYTGGTLASTTIYVRLKAGLPLDIYDGETISNEGGSATAQNVLCNGAVIKPEPTNYVTGFTAVLGNPPYYYNDLSWTDATGGTEPDGYLIKRSYIDFSDIVDPVDGTPESNSSSRQNVFQGEQVAVFTGYAGSTYYYKIFPYTNSDSYIDYKTDGSVPEFSITNANAPTLPITENFEYATGSLLTDNGWVAHSGEGDFPIMVNDNALTYTDYVNSGLGKSVTLIGGSAEDDNRVFDSVYSGSIYASFMVNVESATTSGVYFFHFAPENSYGYRARVYVQNDGTDNLAFGVSFGSNAAEYTLFNYSLNQTYLIVANYTFNTGSTTDDEVKLWIDPVLDGIEPVSDLTQTAPSQVDAVSLGMFALRQGYNGPVMTFGGLRVADTWVPETGTTFPLSVIVVDGWNMVSAPGTNPAGMEVVTWWPHRTGSVFGFNGTQYVAVTDATPGEGYWMKNDGDETYEYTAIEIVAHDPIPTTTGWNMIGGYETSPLITALKRKTGAR
jgi:hypothetical protein